MSANLENAAVATGLEKVSFHSIPKKGSDKESSNHRNAFISHASKFMLRSNCGAREDSWASLGLQDQTSQF